MHIAIINDCRDDNANGRQVTRTASLTGASVSFVGVGDYGDVAASGNLIDILDAFGDMLGVILVNVAPRHHAKEWENGTPFCYFKYKNVWAASSFDGLTLSLVKKLALVDSVSLMDIPEATVAMVERGMISENERQRIIHSQFRSFDFLPRVAAFLASFGNLPARAVPISEIPDAPKAVWWKDNFGNLKTTLLPEEIGFEEGAIIKTKVGPLRCSKQLANVPKETAALTIGSSGLDGRRFLEVVVQGGRADDHFKAGVGSVIIDN